MNIPIKPIVGIMTIAGLLAAFPENTLGQPFTPSAPTARPIILQHPETEVVLEGQGVTFTVQAENPDVSVASPELTYQWQRLTAGTMDFVNIGGATASSYTISNATSIDDVALYRVKVKSDNGVTISEPAHLLVYTTNSPITVYGTPLVSGGGSGTCPGTYAGYVNYKKSAAAGWGWAPNHGSGNATHSATNSRADAKVQAVGIVNDTFCATQVIANTHAGAPAPEDTKYRFTIYFPSNVPTTNFPIVLNGFLP